MGMEELGELMNKKLIVDDDNISEISFDEDDLNAIENQPNTK